MHYFGNCDDIMGDTIIDTELLGYVDGLLLPHASTYTVLSKMMIMKRHKILCGKQMKNSLTYQCVYWDKNGTNGFGKTFWGSYKYSNDWKYTFGFWSHWKRIQANSKWEITNKEWQFFKQNISTYSHIYVN